jgi:hypothetical protein
MDHIVVGIQPFDAKQSVGVYIDGICVKATAVEYTKLAEELSALSQKYKVYNIDIRGQESYCMKLKQDLLVPRYNKEHKLNVTLY